MADARPPAHPPVTAVRFYQVSLWLPILLPALVWLFGKAIPRGPLQYLAWLIPALVFGGIPYCICAIAAASWTEGKPARLIRRLSFFLPAIFLICYWILGLGSAAIFGRSIDKPVLVTAVVFGGFVLVYGYGYVLLVELIRWIGPKLGFIAPF